MSMALSRIRTRLFKAMALQSWALRALFMLSLARLARELLPPAGRIN